MASQNPRCTTRTSFRNSRDQVWLNVASSTHFLKDFVNLDNDVLLWIAKFIDKTSGLIPKKAALKLIPNKYNEKIMQYLREEKEQTIVLHDCRKRLFFDDNTVDHILCSHFLEHVYSFEAKRILADFHRVLKPGGTVHIIVPDLKKQIEKYLNEKQGGNLLAADELLDETILSTKTRHSMKYRVLELHGGLGLQHRWMYDYDSMKHRLEKIGFTIEDQNETPSKHYRENDGSVHIVGNK